MHFLLFSNQNKDPGLEVTDRLAEMIRAKHADRLVREAVWGMMPKGRLGRAQYAKLKVYVGAEHPHAAQKPEPVK